MSDIEKKEDENIGSFYIGRMRKPPQPKRLLPPGLLTTIVLLLLAGLIWYAYPHGAEKYVDMDVPVVKADTTPIKEAPEEPGGMDVPHQDSTVFEPLEKNSLAEVEKLQPAPEEPMDKEQAIIKSSESSKSTVAVKMAPKLDLDLQMKDSGRGLEKVVPKPTETVMPVKPGDKPMRTAVVATAKTAISKNSSSATEGQRLIQLGSYRDMVGAQKDWVRLQKKYSQFLGSLSMKTVKVDIPAKGVFYRLYGGTVTEDRAREICAVLKTANPGGCILVK